MEKYDESNECCIILDENWVLCEVMRDIHNIHDIF